jgi:hypothetical protein
MHNVHLQCSLCVCRCQRIAGATPTERIRLGDVIPDPQQEADLRPEPLEDLVARAMETARKRAGLTVETMARRLRPALRLPDVPPDRKEIRNNWYAWRRNPRAIPAVALVAAARLAGTSVDGLLAEPAPPSSEGRLARLEREVAEQQRIIDELKRAVDQATGQRLQMPRGGRERRP